MTFTTSLPETMKALVCEAKGQPLTLKDIPTPQPVPGSVVVKVLAASLDTDLPAILSGHGFFTFPEPFVPGPRSVGRIAAIGPDTTAFRPDQLVMVEPWLRARDDPTVQALFGIFDGPTPTSQKWFADNWRNASFAEYVRVPLENVWALNEAKLCQQLKYTPAELLHLTTQIVSYGGFRGINLQAGETVIVAPATGSYSGAAVGVAVAMGANVIAASRNITALQQIQSLYPAGRVNIVQLTNDVDKDTAALTSFGTVDAYIDISPPAAEKTTHVRSCFNALKTYGRASLMGVLNQDVAIPYVSAVFKSVTIKGQYMYEQDDVRTLIKLAENGVLKLGKEAGYEVVGEFGLGDLDKAFARVESVKSGQVVVLVPLS